MWLSPWLAGWLAGWLPDVMVAGSLPCHLTVLFLTPLFQLHAVQFFFIAQVFPYNIFAYCSICRVDCKFARNNNKKKTYGSFRCAFATLWSLG
jgi:hypothetical protein